MFVERHSGQSLSNFRFSIPAPAHLTLNSHRIISFADPHPLTTIESYRYKNRGGRVYSSGSQLLLLSKLKATINRAESTLLQVFFLKNLKPFGITTFKKQGEGSPLWLTNCSKRVSARRFAGMLTFHLPYTLPSSVSRNSFICHSYENCRVCGYSSHFGTEQPGASHSLRYSPCPGPLSPPSVVRFHRRTNITCPG